ncbi:MAG: GNAT family N-acetyltransferase [Gaiellaceae bacterium]
MAAADLDVLYEHGRDDEANRLAVFGARDPSDRAAFDRKWERIMSGETGVARTILCDGRVAGTVSSWRDPELDAPEVTYWLGREFWGLGIATSALGQFLREVPERPLLGRAVVTNVSSIRVLEKCGFVRREVHHGVVAPSGRVVDEVLLELRDPAHG